MYNTKNYTEQNGEKTVIGGTLEILSGATLTGFPQAANVAEASGDAPTAAEFKALLDALIAAGLMAAGE
jgi:hypothetical protein